MINRIAFVTNQIKDCAPIDIISQIIEYIRDKGFEPIVISLRPQSEKDVPAYFPKNVRCGSLNKSFLELELHPMRVAKELYSCLYWHKIDIAHSHSYQADIICSYLPKKIRTITTQHNIAEEDFCLGKGFLLGSWMAINLVERLKEFDYIVGVSQTVTQYCLEKTKSKVPMQTIYNNVVLPNVSVRKDDESNRIVYCGSLNKRKDPLLLLNAFTQLLDERRISDDCVLEILGDGVLRKKVERIASIYPNNIIVRGFVANPANIMASCDVFVSCSRSEGLGLSLIESISMGLIPVCTKIPPFNEIIGDCDIVKKLQFEKGDVLSLKESIVRSLNIHKDSISDFVQSVRNKFLDGQMAARYLDVYTNMIKLKWIRFL